MASSWPACEADVPVRGEVMEGRGLSKPRGWQIHLAMHSHPVTQSSWSGCAVAGHSRLGVAPASRNERGQEEGVLPISRRRILRWLTSRRRDGGLVEDTTGREAASSSPAGADDRGPHAGAPAVRRECGRETEPLYMPRAPRKRWAKGDWPRLANIGLD